MNDVERKKQEMEKKEFSIKVMYFNRYLIIRYLTAGFFFVHLNWLVLLLLKKSPAFWLPLVFLVFLLPVVGEQVALYRKHKNTTLLTGWYFKIQGVVNVLLVMSIFTPLYHSFFPFMANGEQGKALTLFVVVSGILICLFCQRRLSKIHTNEDRHYQRIKKYEQVVHYGKGSN